jgi:hypothetical protein
MLSISIAADFASNVAGTFGTARAGLTMPPANAMRTTDVGLVGRDDGRGEIADAGPAEFTGPSRITTSYATF